MLSCTIVAIIFDYTYGKVHGLTNFIVFANDSVCCQPRFDEACRVFDAMQQTEQSPTARIINRLVHGTPPGDVGLYKDERMFTTRRCLDCDDIVAFYTAYICLYKSREFHRLNNPITYTNEHMSYYDKSAHICDACAPHQKAVCFERMCRRAMTVRQSGRPIVNVKGDIRDGKCILS